MASRKRNKNTPQMVSKETNNNIPPGFTLRYTLSGHTEEINRFA